MNTYMIRLGVKDADGNNLYYVSDSARNFSAPKEEALVFDSLGAVAEFILLKKAMLRENANNFGWQVSVEDEYFEVDLAYINLKDEEVERERVRRLKALNIEPLALEEAINNKTIYISENMGLPYNVNYFLPGYTYEKEVRQALTKVDKNRGVPYWVIVDHLRDGGLLINILYVSLYKNNWEYERLDPNGIISACVVNTNDETVDNRYIKIRCIHGGVKRLYD